MTPAMLPLWEHVNLPITYRSTKAGVMTPAMPPEMRLAGR